MPLVNLTLPPGIYRSDTELESAGRWYDSNLVRWSQGVMQPIGGWRLRSSSPVTGRASGIFAWRDNSQNLWAAVGTEQKLYVYEGGTTRHDITPTGYTVGRAGAEYGVGYGTGYYGAIQYGVPRLQSTLSGVLPATAWTMDNFGQYLLACATTDGKIYQWTLSTASAAAVVSGAPTGNAGIIVTEERFLFALGAGGNPRKVQWADQESLTSWTPSSTNQAGDVELQTLGSIVCARRARGGALIVTTADAHFAKYVGPPYIYSFERVGTGCGIVSTNAIAAIDAGAVWMGESGFWHFDGYAKPLASDVADYVFSDINRDQISKVSAVHNLSFGEVMWLYPSSESQECDRYIVWNYRENHWSIGQLARTVGTGQGIFSVPLMMSTDGYLYEHEIGWNYSGAVPYAETGPIQLGNGDRVMMVRGIVPDERTAGQVQVKFYSKFYPNTSETMFGPYSMSSPTDVRFTARQLKMRVEPVVNDQWRVGVMRLETIIGGLR